jgi:hypothetical protein
MTSVNGATNFYNWIEFNVKNYPKNTTPALIEHPRRMTCCNQRTEFNFESTDVDGDSLSYHLGEAYTGSGKKLAYNTGYSALVPVKVHGTKPDPTKDPATGFHIDNAHGLVTFVPTGCSDVAPFVVVVKEWRKDSKGVYQNIGESKVESQIEVIMCTSNNPPVLTSSKDYTICEGQQLTIDLSTVDKVKVPPPPLPKPDPDTTKIEALTFIKGAKFELGADTMLNQTGKFTWTPDSGSASDIPYTFLVKTYDKVCDWPTMDYSRFNITVKPNIKAKLSRQETACGNYELDATYDSKKAPKATISREVTDLKGTVYTDSTVVLFKASGNAMSSRGKDSLIIYKPGKYILHTVFDANLASCPQEVFDTFDSDGHMDLIRLQDTTFCQHEDFSFEISDDHAKNLTSYEWTFKSNKDTSKKITKRLEASSPMLFVAGTGNTGCMVYDSVLLTTVYSPGINDLKDSLYCGKGNPPIYRVVDLLDSGLVTTTYAWNTGNTDDTIHLSSPGTYWVKATNECGSKADTFEVFFDIEYKIELGPNLQICDDPFVAIGDSVPVPGVKYLWRGGDTTSSINAGAIGSYRVTVTNRCGSYSDSVFVHFDKTPEPIHWPDTILYCDQVKDIYDAQNPGFRYYWDDGTKGRTKNIDRTGLHYVEVQSIHCGHVRDTTYADLMQSPKVDLGNDSIVPFGFSKTLDAGLQDVTYLWSTGDTTQNIIADTFGTYWVELKNECDTVRDSVTFTHNMSIIVPDGPSNITIVPNPNQGEFVLTGSTEKIIAIMVFDNLGRNINYTMDWKTKEVVLSAPESGIYFMRIVTSDGWYTERLVVDK